MRLVFNALLRHKTSTILNIIGLSCAFATFIIISMQIKYDVTFDKHNKNFDTIYQLSFRDDTSGDASFWLNRQNPIKFKEDIPEIEHISIIGYKGDRLTLIGDNESENNIIAQHITTCDEDITKIFTFNFIEGDGSALNDPNNLMVSDKFAKKWYGEKSPIGEKIANWEKIYTIAAVYESLPENSTIQGDIFSNIGDENMERPGSSNYSAFIKLNENCSKIAIDEKLEKSYYGDKISEKKYSSNVIELAEVRYIVNGYDKNFIYIMIVIALSIVILAAINFINFATSMVPLKIKAINLRKVVGATDTELRMSVIWESLILTFISFFIALAAVEIFKNSALSHIISNVSWEANQIIYIIAFGVMLLTGIVSGLYPAFYSTSFQPALVLKSSYAMSASGVKFRKALIGFQFFIALSFIATTIFIQLQHDYLINRDGGYVKEGIIHVNHGLGYDKHDLLKGDLLQNPQIEDVTFAHGAFGTPTGGMIWGRGYSKGYVRYDAMPVAHNFLDFFEIKIDSGRNFMQSDEISENGYFIMSRGTMDKFQIPIGEKISGHREPTEIVGICENIHLRNMKVSIEPFTFFIFGKYGWGGLPHAYIKVSSNSKEVFDYIRNSYTKSAPDIIVDMNYLTTELENAYSDENTTKQIMQSFSFIAIIIALVGVFGLVSFDTKFRRKEIGLRRINGATVNSILAMFSTSYVKIVLISFVLSVPVVYYMIFTWLNSFPYKIAIYWWVFALALIMVLILTVTISIIQTIRMAKENPINTLKTT